MRSLTSSTNPTHSRTVEFGPFMDAVICFPSFIVPATDGEIFTAYEHEEIKKRIHRGTTNAKYCWCCYATVLSRPFCAWKTWGMRRCSFDLWGNMLYIQKT